jgi:hypothetical protein
MRHQLQLIALLLDPRVGDPILRAALHQARRRKLRWRATFRPRRRRIEIAVACYT